MNLCIQCWFDEIFDTLQTVCLGCDCYVTIRSALHCYRTRNTWLKCASSLRMRVTLLYWPLFYTYFAIDFSERAIPANIDRSIMLTARMGRYDIKVALLRCLIRLIIFNILNWNSLSFASIEVCIINLRALHYISCSVISNFDCILKVLIGVSYFKSIKIL